MPRPVLPCRHCGGPLAVVGVRASGPRKGELRRECRPCRDSYKARWDTARRDPSRRLQQPPAHLLQLARKREFIETRGLDADPTVTLHTPWAVLAALGRTG
jgi:hypothetical protein